MPPSSELIDLYTRPLRADELVLSVDEKTSLQPRPRLHPDPASPAPEPAQPRTSMSTSGRGPQSLCRL